MTSRLLMFRYPFALFILSFVLFALTDKDGGQPLFSVLAAASVLWGGAVLIYKIVRYMTAPVPASAGGSSNENKITINVNSDAPKESSEAPPTDKREGGQVRPLLSFVILTCIVSLAILASMPVQAQTISQERATEDTCSKALRKLENKEADPDTRLLAVQCMTWLEVRKLRKGR